MKKTDLAPTSILAQAAAFFRSMGSRTDASTAKGMSRRAFLKAAAGTTIAVATGVAAVPEVAVAAPPPLDRDCRYYDANSTPLLTPSVYFNPENPREAVVIVPRQDDGRANASVFRISGRKMRQQVILFQGPKNENMYCVTLDYELIDGQPPKFIEAAVDAPDGSPVAQKILAQIIGPKATRVKFNRQSMGDAEAAFVLRISNDVPVALNTLKNPPREAPPFSKDCSIISARFTPACEGLIKVADRDDFGVESFTTVFTGYRGMGSNPTNNQAIRMSFPHGEYPDIAFSLPMKQAPDPTPVSPVWKFFFGKYQKPAQASMASCIRQATGNGVWGNIFSDAQKIADANRLSNPSLATKVAAMREIVTTYALVRAGYGTKAARQTLIHSQEDGLPCVDIPDLPKNSPYKKVSIKGVAEMLSIEFGLDLGDYMRGKRPDMSKKLRGPANGFNVQ